MRRLAIHHRAAPAMKPSGPPKIIDPIRAAKSGRTALLVQKMRAVPSAAAAEAARAQAVLERALDDARAARALEGQAVVDGRGNVAARALGELALEDEVDGRAPRRGDAEREPVSRRRHLRPVEERRTRE